MTTQLTFNLQPDRRADAPVAGQDAVVVDIRIQDFAGRLAPESLDDLIDSSEFTLFEDTLVGISERNQTVKCQPKVFIDPELGRPLFNQLVPNWPKSPRSWSVRQLLIFDARNRDPTACQSAETGGLRSRHRPFHPALKPISPAAHSSHKTPADPDSTSL